MRNALLFSITSLAVTFLFLSCTTTAEKRVERERQAEMIAKALEERHYKIKINTMHPMRGGTMPVSYGYSVEVKNDSLISYLPYFGRAYSIPFPGSGKGQNFAECIREYWEQTTKKGCTQIKIKAINEEDTYLYTIELYSNGNASVDVQPRQREQISYSGEMDL